MAWQEESGPLNALISRISAEEGIKCIESPQGGPLWPRPKQGGNGFYPDRDIFVERPEKPEDERLCSMTVPLDIKAEMLDAESRIRQLLREAINFSGNKIQVKKFSVDEA